MPTSGLCRPGGCVVVECLAAVGFSHRTASGGSAWSRRRVDASVWWSTVFRDGGGVMSGTRRKPGRLGPYVDGYRLYLLGLGYTRETVRGQLKVRGQLGRWMAARGVSPAGLSSGHMDAFLADRRADEYRQVPYRRGLVLLRQHLIDEQVIAQEHVDLAAGQRARVPTSRAYGRCCGSSIGMTPVYRRRCPLRISSRCWTVATGPLRLARANSRSWHWWPGSDCDRSRSRAYSCRTCIGAAAR